MGKKSVRSTYTKLICLFAAALALSACEILENERNAINGAFPGPGSRPVIGHDPLGPSCSSETYYQPQAEVTKNIDLLFVVDTSGSLNSEREQIAEGIDAFIDVLPADVNAQFAVMLAHVGERSGRLYRKDENHPYVLNTDVHSRDEIRAILRNRMMNPAGESVSDGGEAGLYSLYHAFDSDKLLQSQIEGFFRFDAALAVSFVADENDICAVYPEGVDRVFDSNLKELPAFDNYCSGITPQSVFDRVLGFQQNRPLVMSGIIYNPESDFPQTGENEIGYGYLETIQLANGMAVDLAGDHLHQGLEQIGDLTSRKLLLTTEFPLAGSGFDAQTMIVEVDGVVVAHNYEASTNTVHLLEEAGTESSEVYIAYCEPTTNENPVIISNVQVYGITSTTVTLTWDTDILATSQVEVYNPGSAEVHFTDKTDVAGATYHHVMVVELNSNTLYELRAVSESIVGQTSPSFSAPVRVRTRR